MHILALFFLFFFFKRFASNSWCELNILNQCQILFFIYLSFSVLWGGWVITSQALVTYFHSRFANNLRMGSHTKRFYFGYILGSCTCN